MQPQMGEMEEELMRTKEKLDAVELEKRQILEQLRESNTPRSPNKANRDLLNELESLQKSRDELRAKDSKIESLESELRKARELDQAKNSSLERLNEELVGLKEREKHATNALHESKKRAQELASEIERLKEVESKMADSLVNRTKQLDMTIFHLEESKIEIVSLQEKIESLERENFVTRKSSKETTIFHEQEMEAMREKCRVAVEAEEKSTKALDDFALALKEVATESSKAKERLVSTRNELDHLKAEAEHLKNMVREAQQESEQHKNTVERLRVEAEESLLAMSAKEMGFVNCIKLAEEEKVVAQRESHRLSESLKAAENMTRAAREETYKLRDILKQAVNEANVAKSAAGIARDENSVLKDSLSEKEERLHFLTKENERLRMSEAALHENMKQLKILLSRGGYSSELKNNEEYYDIIEEENEEISYELHHQQQHHSMSKMMNKSFSFNLEDLKFMTEPEETVLDEDPVKAEALKGSIFDSNAETPKSEPRTPKSARLRGILETGKKGGDETDHQDLPPEPDRGAAHRRTKTMFQRVGDLLAIRRNYHRKEAGTPGTIEHAVSANPALN